LHRNTTTQFRKLLLDELQQSSPKVEFTSTFCNIATTCVGIVYFFYNKFLSFSLPVFLSNFPFPKGYYAIQCRPGAKKKGNKEERAGVFMFTKVLEGVAV
jgi:hypothetical protein